jgi:protein involved in polysaccharide export with SLBB domain
MSSTPKPHGWQRFAVGLLLALLCWSARSAEDAAAQRYRLGPGDLVRIEVFGEKDMSLETRVSDQGTVTYWLLGPLPASGKTVNDLQNLITQRLKGPYLVDPRVHVSVVEHRPFFIVGEVKNPGGYPYEPGMTVGRAIILAGGLTERASRRRIYVTHEGEPSDQRSRLSADDRIRPGDTVTVEAGFF